MTHATRDGNGNESVGELLPILVADLAEESARDLLEELSRVGGEAWVPLVSAPMDRRAHLLEIHTPESAEPLRLLAEPLGGPSAQGYPLRLFPYDDADVGGISEVAAALPSEAPAANARASVGPPRFPSEHRISDSHSAHLAGQSEPEPKVQRDALIGRGIAGDKLEIESILGAGSIGAVYLARHRGLHLPVAVKVLHRAFQRDVEFCRRFYAEALAMSRLDHPNLVRVQDFGQETDGLLYLSMAYLDGTTLRTMLEKESPLDPTRVIELMVQVCAGLAHAHGRGLIHRDVKPDNVMVVTFDDDDGRHTEQVKLCDFGFAVPPSVTSSVAQRLAGTPVYMSPEQCRGEELDGRTDLYACGAMMYELLTGSPPFLAGDARTIMQMHVSAPVPSAARVRPDVDPRLDRIVQRSLAKNRDERQANIQELRAELKELLRPAPRVEPARESGAHRTADPPDARTSASRLSVASLSPPPPSVAAPPSSARALEARDPRAATSSTPDWLESSVDYQGFLTGMDTARSQGLTETLARDPKEWLKKFATEHDPRAFSQRLAELEGSVRAFAQRADAKTLWAISSTLHVIASGPSGPMAQGAARVLALFSTPELLGPLAERFLSRDDDAKESARTLITQARVAGAYALYGARLKLAGHHAARISFVTAMQKLGEHGWPVIRAALDRIPDAAMTGEHPRAAELAEDLLLCVPNLRDDDAGQLVAKYANARVPSLCRAAARALTKLWGERARPLLLGLVTNADDGVRMAAVIGLREIDAVDVHAVRRIAPLLDPSVAGPQARAAAVAALVTALPDARQLAAGILAQAVREPALDDATVIAAARALLGIAGVAAVDVIRERASLSVAPLRGQLDGLLR